MSNNTNIASLTNEASTRSTADTTETNARIAADTTETNARIAADNALTASSVPRTSTTGSAQLPAGTTAQRDATPTFGSTRANSDLTQTEWWNGTAWVTMGGGATGAPGNYVFIENDQVVTANYTITAGKNAGSFGPITIANGVVVTVGTGQVWTIT